MRTLALLVACLVVAACAVPTLTPVRPGSAVVESVHRSTSESAFAYGNYPAGHLVTVRMADGSIQRLSSVSGAYRPGQRVEITPEGKIFISQ
jgi:hypothetical protein